MDIQQIVENLKKDTTSVDEIIDGVGVAYAEQLCAALTAEGFKVVDGPTECKVAVFERHLRKGKRRVEVLASNFLGKFVQVESWGRPCNG